MSSFECPLLNFRCIKKIIIITAISSLSRACEVLPGNIVSLAQTHTNSLLVWTFLVSALLFFYLPGLLVSKKEAPAANIMCPVFITQFQFSTEIFRFLQIDPMKSRPIDHRFKSDTLPPPQFLVLGRQYISRCTAFKP